VLQGVQDEAPRSSCAGVEDGGEFPLPIRLWDLGSIVRLLSGVWGKGPAKNKFGTGTSCLLQNTSVTGKSINPICLWIAVPAQINLLYNPKNQLIFTNQAS